MIFGEDALPAYPFGGWVSLIVQTGSLGLLAYIVIYGFPKYEQALREERERRDELFVQTIRLLQENFAERNETLVAKSEGHKQALEALVERAVVEHNLTRELIKTMREKQ